jgi:hypothetical protein
VSLIDSGFASSKTCSLQPKKENLFRSPKRLASLKIH